MKIAIVGSGISGLAAAWLLNHKYDITLFEKNDYLGGHSNTATINYQGSNINVDTGFIVFNFRTYPNLKAFFELLNVEIEKSDMSFGIKSLDSGFEYSGRSLSGLFAQKKNLLDWRFWAMIKDIVKFNKNAIALVESKGVGASKSLGQFIDELGFGQYFKDYYLLPMAGAIWSCPLELMKQYPAKTFLQFFYNHGLLTVTDQPQWYTVKGGSKEYVKKMSASFKNKVKLQCGIVKSRQKGDKVLLTDEKGDEHEFDQVIFASHADQTYRIISDKSPEEEEILSKIKYSQNRAVLHRDEGQMPVNKKAWSSWVYLSDGKEKQVSLSYWMNNLQNIDHKYPLFVTLNPISDIDKQLIFGEYEYEHPIFDADAIKAQESLEKIQGKRNIWFCGAWAQYGFHEDGLKSALSVAKALGVKAPWR